jgi:hypothetical protein
MTDKLLHEGRNVKRLREILGMKQDTLAFEPAGGFATGTKRSTG